MPNIVEFLHPSYIAASVILPIIFAVLWWAKGVTGSLKTIKDNHLAHIEESTAETNQHLIKIVTILEERRK